MKLLISTILTTFVSLVSFSASASFEATAYGLDPRGVAIEITNNGDTVTITDASINNGDCPTSRFLTRSENRRRFTSGRTIPMWPFLLKSGDTLKVGNSHTNCHVRSLRLTTDLNETLDFNW